MQVNHPGKSDGLASSFPPRVSLGGEPPKLIHITGRQSEGERRKNTFICVKEKMRRDGWANRPLLRKQTGPDKYVLLSS